MYEGIYQSKEEKQESLRSIGNRICFFRKNTGMTQAQLASLVDIDYRTLSRYENGNSEIEYSGRFYTPIPEIGNRSSDVKETALPF